MTRKAFEEYDEPVNIDMDPEEALKIVLNPEGTGASRPLATQVPSEATPDL
jgi:hypothetical protein